MLKKFHVVQFPPASLVLEESWADFRSSLSCGVLLQAAAYWRLLRAKQNPTQHPSTPAVVQMLLLGCNLWNRYFCFSVTSSPFFIPVGHDIDMLPPFRVRTLRPSASLRLGRSKNKEFNALVRITAPEYDKTLRICPEASLKYLDEEDGEIVTVWSRTSTLYCSVLM